VQDYPRLSANFSIRLDRFGSATRWRLFRGRVSPSVQEISSQLETIDAAVFID
jgi:hypothetical protein